MGGIKGGEEWRNGSNREIILTVRVHLTSILRTKWAKNKGDYGHIKGIQAFGAGDQMWI